MMFALWYSLNHIAIKSRGPIKMTNPSRLLCVMWGIGCLVWGDSLHSKMVVVHLTIQWRERRRCKHRTMFEFMLQFLATERGTNCTHSHHLDQDTWYKILMWRINDSDLILFYFSLLNLVFTMFMILARALLLHPFFSTQKNLPCR